MQFCQYLRYITGVSTNSEQCRNFSEDVHVFSTIKQLTIWQLPLQLHTNTCTHTRAHTYTHFLSLSSYIYYTSLYIKLFARIVIILKYFPTILKFRENKFLIQSYIPKKWWYKERERTNKWMNGWMGESMNQLINQSIHWLINQSCPWVWWELLPCFFQATGRFFQFIQRVKHITALVQTHNHWSRSAALYQHIVAHRNLNKQRQLSWLRFCWHCRKQSCRGQCIKKHFIITNFRW